jgi:hypothetical protein
LSVTANQLTSISKLHGGKGFDSSSKERLVIVILLGFE